MLVKINLVVIFVSLSLGLPLLSQDKPLPNTTLLDLPTTSPPLAEAKKMEQSLLVKEMAKVNKERAPAMEEAAKMKNSEKQETKAKRRQVQGGSRVGEVEGEEFHFAWRAASVSVCSILLSATSCAARITNNRI